MDQIKLVPDIPQWDQCKLCKGQYDSEIKFTVKILQDKAIGIVKLCDPCKKTLQTIDPGKIYISFWRMGRKQIDIEEIRIDTEKSKM